MTARPGAAYPFSAIVGQDTLKLALLLNAVDPRVGGVIIRGERGTAKSTAVRALGAILPPVDVVDGCPYGCDPGQPAGLCDCCGEAASGPLASHRARPRIVELPVSATEDRLVGTLDFQAALREGERSFQPGLLAEANRGILYVDEVNLLDDHLVDTLLDAAAMGVNTVEREGISVSHPARFILVGTMNPEEGEVRPQLLDRFGLCVEVEAVREPESRVEIVRRRRAFEDDPAGFAEEWAPYERDLEGRIAAARERVASVEIPEPVLYAIADLSLRARVDGHRADTVMARAACAHAALDGRAVATLADVERVAELPLMHRMRSEPLGRADTGVETLRESLRRILKPFDATSSGGESEPDVVPGGQGRMFDPLPPADGAADTVSDVRLAAGMDRLRRTSGGSRQRTVSDDGRGRYVRSEPSVEVGGVSDVAIDATIRAAAGRFGSGADSGGGMAITVTPEDVRAKVRTRTTATSIVLCVDASGSMGASRRMEAAKAAAIRLLEDAYVKRDRVSLVTFRGDDAEVVLAPTSSVELARLRLGTVAVGGATPLAAGLSTALDVARSERRRDPSAVVWIAVVTDGKANVGRAGVLGREDALNMAKRIAEEGVKAIVLDADPTGSGGAGLSIASAARADYVRLGVVSADGIVTSVTQRLGAR